MTYKVGDKVRFVTKTPNYNAYYSDGILEVDADEWYDTDDKDFLISVKYLDVPPPFSEHFNQIVSTKDVEYAE